MAMTATTNAYDDARIIGKGIRLGGSRKIVAALEAALAEGPLTPDQIERFAHPDWDRVTFEEEISNRESQGPEAVGLACLYGPDQMNAPRLPPSWGLAASWYGWLPGFYVSREAALLAYGYVLGGEGAGGIEGLRDQINRGEYRPIAPSDLIAFAESGGAVPAEHDHSVVDVPPGTVLLCSRVREAGGEIRVAHLSVDRAVWFGFEEARETARTRVRAVLGDAAAPVYLVVDPDC